MLPSLENSTPSAAESIVKAVHDSKLREEDQKLMVKSDEELIGEHLYIKRDGADDVDVNLYRGESDTPHPEYESLHFHDSKSPEQEKMARQAEDAIGAWIAKQ